MRTSLRLPSSALRRSLPRQTPCLLARSLQHPHYTLSRASALPTARQFSSYSSSALLASEAEPASGLPPINDTIYALSTAPGKAGIAVIRISGPSALEIYKSVCPRKPVPQPRYATVRTLYAPRAPPERGIVLDTEAVVLYLPSPRTATGEDVLELHVHGGTATVKAVLAAISRCPSAPRYAEPGEFTKRAFVNDRLDLAQIEALSDALAAETEQQRRAAVRGNSGKLGRTYEGWREQLLLARGEIEALIDFSEDQHFDESQSDLLESVVAQVEAIVDSIGMHEVASRKSELLRSGIKIALVGPPNAGKSSLMNLIVGREASIVSGEAGTTRDIVEASLDIRGYLCSFADTAGFRSTTSLTGQFTPIGAVEEEGIRRAKEKARNSDIVVVVASVENSARGPVVQYDADTLDLAADAESFLVIVNKRDTVSDHTLSRIVSDFRHVLMDKSEKLGRAVPIAVSCVEAQKPALRERDPGSVGAVIDALDATFGSMTSLPVDMQDLLGVTERQRQLLVKCRRHLEEFLVEAQPEEDGVDADSVLAAEYLRYAADCLARITGKGEASDVEDVLGVVFEKFCVGK